MTVDMRGWPGHPEAEAARIDRCVDRMGLLQIMLWLLETMQAQIARVQPAMDPPDPVIRIPRDARQFQEFRCAAELIGIGREEARKSPGALLASR